VPAVFDYVKLHAGAVAAALVRFEHDVRSDALRLELRRAAVVLAPVLDVVTSAAQGDVEARADSAFERYEVVGGAVKGKKRHRRFASAAQRHKRLAGDDRNRRKTVIQVAGQGRREESTVGEAHGIDALRIDAKLCGQRVDQRPDEAGVIDGAVACQGPVSRLARAVRRDGDEAVGVRGRDDIGVALRQAGVTAETVEVEHQR
jgi:hypothetical protein